MKVVTVTLYMVQAGNVVYTLCTMHMQDHLLDRRDIHKDQLYNATSEVTSILPMSMVTMKLSRGRGIICKDQSKMPSRLIRFQYQCFIG